MAARISVEIGADLAILMSDVDGIYNKPPSLAHMDSRILHTFIPSDLEMVEFGEKSSVGTGGMESKVYHKLQITPLQQRAFIINAVAICRMVGKLRITMAL